MELTICLPSRLMKNYSVSKEQYNFPPKMHVTQTANDMKYLVKLTSTNQKCKIRLYIRVTFLNLGHSPN